jgi:hypothetical protein
LSGNSGGRLAATFRQVRLASLLTSITISC